MIRTDYLSDTRAHYRPTATDRETAELAHHIADALLAGAELFVGDEAAPVAEMPDDVTAKLPAVPEHEHHRNEHPRWTDGMLRAHEQLTARLSSGVVQAVVPADESDTAKVRIVRSNGG